MTKRGPISIFFLTIITFGIYLIVWRIKTKREMNKLGCSIPTSWLMIVPIANIWWLWEYSAGVSKVTNNTYSQAVAFLLLFLIPVIGDSIMQDAFNKVTPAATVSAA